MAAPTLQAEGSLSVVTTASNSPTIPTHQADDILLLSAGVWFPNSLGANGPSAPGGWTQLGTTRVVLDGLSEVDGAISQWWLRATGAGTTVTVTHDGDTGNDTAFGARVYVIRGCITSGDPFDEAVTTAALTSANGSVSAITVSGSERMVVQFLNRTDDYTTAPTLSGWTAGTQVESTTGTDYSMASYRKDNVSSSTSADAATVEAPAQGFYTFTGVSFKPPSAAAEYIPYRNPVFQILPQ